MVFEPNPYYTGDLKPQVDQIIVRFYSDPQYHGSGRSKWRD